jgi:Fe-S oxidoreductase
MKGRQSNNTDAPAVVLFPDCFTTYNEPHIGRAAVLALEKLGYRVVLPKLGCCGRTHISTGWLQKARDVCCSTASALLQEMRTTNAVAVVACEPSCLSAMKDEWLELDMGDRIDVQLLRDLAARSFLVEQFIHEHWDDHPRRPQMRETRDSRSFILHGHCHQKALWGVESSANTLWRVFGERVRVLDSGCCGMAGQFGYAREHYDLSMKIGELSLFHALRPQPDAIIVAPGTSCRQQIHDGMAGREALHPIELLAEAL